MGEHLDAVVAQGRYVECSAKVLDPHNAVVTGGVRSVGDDAGDLYVQGMQMLLYMNTVLRMCANRIYRLSDKNAKNIFKYQKFLHRDRK